MEIKEKKKEIQEGKLYSKVWIETNLQPDDLFCIYLLAKRDFTFGHIWVGESKANIQYSRAKRYLEALRKDGFDVGQPILHQGYDSLKKSPIDGQEWDMGGPAVPPCPPSESVELKENKDGLISTHQKDDVTKQEDHVTEKGVYEGLAPHRGYGGTAGPTIYKLCLQEYLETTEQPVLFMMKPPREFMELVQEEESNFDLGLLRKATLYLSGGSNLRLVTQSFHKTFVERFREFNPMDDEDFDEIQETVREKAYRTLCKRFELFGRVYFVESLHSIAEKSKIHLSTSYPEGKDLYLQMKSHIASSCYLQAMFTYTRLWNEYLFQACRKELQSQFIVMGGPAVPPYPPGLTTVDVKRVEKGGMEGETPTSDVKEVEKGDIGGGTPTITIDLLDKCTITVEELRCSFEQKWSLKDKRHLEPFLATYKMYSELHELQSLEFQFSFDDIILGLVAGDDFYSTCPAYLYLNSQGTTTLENTPKGDKDKKPISLYYNLNYKQLIQDILWWIGGPAAPPYPPCQ